jgi:xanthine/uracil permease
MYAGAIAVPLIVGRALQFTPEQVAMLIRPICSSAAS